MSMPPAPQVQPRNPLHGLTLQTILTALVDRYGWADLAQRIPIRCFSSDPSIQSRGRHKGYALAPTLMSKR